MVTERLVARIESFNSGRLSMTLPLKYEAMAENAFRFYRGTAHIFYDAICHEPAFSSCPRAWLCGDLHLENFGTFRGDNRLVYFDLNDYDEASLGPVSWEVARLTCSIFVAFRTLKIPEKKALKMASLFIRSYAATLAKGKSISIETRHAQGIVGDFLLKINKRKQNDLLQKRTKKRHKELEILMSHQKHIEMDAADKSDLLEHIERWLKNDDDSPYNYKPLDCAFRVAGTSSLGLTRYVVLLKSLNKNGERYLLLDMKEAAPSYFSTLLPGEPPAFDNEATRIVTIQRNMQDRCPALLSTSEYNGVNYIMQEMQPEEDNINFGLLANRYRDMYMVIDNMAMLTASAQLRSSGHRGSAINDELRAWGNRTDWHDAILEYARGYANTVNDDFEYYRAQYVTGAISMTGMNHFM